MEEWECWERVTWDEAVRGGGRKPIRTRWVDVNKGDEASPDVRARLVAQDFALGRDDSFYAATPPLEALRLLISDLTTGQGEPGGGPVKLMLLDAKKAHLHAAAERDLFISLPAEAGGGYARLLRSLYGARDAPALWEAFAAAQLQQLGFVRGKSNPCVFWHPKRKLRCLVHGDDFIVSGTQGNLEWLHRALAQHILLKRVGILGLSAEDGDVAELKILNRVLRMGPGGVRYEADPRHAEILAMMLASSTTPVSTPGVKLPVHDCRNPLEPKVFVLDTGGADGSHEAAWGSEEEEECVELEHSHAVRRARAGRRERAVAGTKGQDRDVEEREVDPEGGGELLEAAETSLYRATAARANYLALDRPELAFAAKELCRRMSAPRRADLLALRRLCRFLLGLPRLVYEFAWQPSGQPLVKSSKAFQSTRAESTTAPSQSARDWPGWPGSPEHAGTFCTSRARAAIEKPGFRRVFHCITSHHVEKGKQGDAQWAALSGGVSRDSPGHHGVGHHREKQRPRVQAGRQGQRAEAHFSQPPARQSRHGVQH